MSLEALKARIDCHDLAERLGLERPQARGNYRSPHHRDKSPSLSVYEGGRRWKDWSDGAGGTCIDLVMYVQRTEFEDAVRWLRKEYDLPAPAPARAAAPQRPASLPEFIAAQCLKDPSPALDYLVLGRKIPETTAQAAISLGTVGWNTYTNPKVAPGEVGHGGPALATIVRTANPGHIVAVDLRYQDPALNGGVKTMSQGDKVSQPWAMDPRAMARADRVVIVESAINALTVEACGLRRTTAIATRGTALVDQLDVRPLLGRQVIICMDWDSPDKKGRCPGQEAAWAIYDRCAAHGVAAVMVDQSEWAPGTDLNDLLQSEGLEAVQDALAKLEPWAIPGQHGRGNLGRSRVFLPAHDFGLYWRYRCESDFTRYIERMDSEEGDESPRFMDVAGMRIASLSRITVQSANATLTGAPDHAPETLFAATVQAPRHGAKLLRRVMTDEQIHSPDAWRKLGAIYAPAKWSRLINIWERAADLGQVRAVNFVGLCWQGGRLKVNEGPDTFFRIPHQQCPYHSLTFPRGSTADARRVLLAYKDTMGDCAGLQILVWALGSALKALLGFWPHMVVQARKGAGKSTLSKALQRTVAMTVFGGATLNTDFRMFCSVSGTTHPVGWEELSAREVKIIAKAQSLLQDAYQFNVSPRGSDLVEFVVAAPVMLLGEDVPVNSLIGKTVSARLERQGAEIPEDLPPFPLRPWLEWLASQGRTPVREAYDRALRYCTETCRAAATDAGAARMLKNYAAVGATWDLLCQWSELDSDTGDWWRCLVEAMNTHIRETSADREPWVWILEIALSEIAAGTFRHPYLVDTFDGEMALIIRPGHVMDHLAHSPGLRAAWDACPIKSARVFRRQLDQAEVVLSHEAQRVIDSRRWGHMTALSVPRLEAYGLLVPQKASAADIEPRDLP